MGDEYFVGYNTPLNIYNGTTKGCPTRDLRATFAILNRFINYKGTHPLGACSIINVHRCKMIFIPSEKTPNPILYTPSSISYLGPTVSHGLSSSVYTANTVSGLKGHIIEKAYMYN